MLWIYSQREDDPNTSQVSQLLFNSDHLLCVCVLESLSPAGS